MSCVVTENFYFAFRKDTQEPVHISQMLEKDRGMACNCICASCRRPLIAKLGRGKRIRHFAHKSEGVPILDCSAQKANESGLHKMAKELICQSGYINLPAIKISSRRDSNRNEDDPAQCKDLIFLPKTQLPFSRAETEIPFQGFIPDICIYTKKDRFLIEIAVTHYTDKKKYDRIKQANLPTIEIDISDFLKNAESFSKEHLRQALIESVEHKKWIYHRKESDGEKALLERNRRLEMEYQKKQKQEQDKQERLKNWIAEQKLHEEQVLLRLNRLSQDKSYYLKFDQKLINDKQSLNVINSLAICSLCFSSVDDIPCFLNIPISGEVAFRCDRRIWQSILFEKFIYNRKPGSVIAAKKIYFYFAMHEKSRLNLDFVHLRKNYFPKNCLLRFAIDEYLVHLSQLGFIEHSYYEVPNSEAEYAVLLRDTLRPSNQSYQKFLQEVLPQMPLTNQPFAFLANAWKHYDEI